MNRTELLIQDSDVKVLKNRSILLQYFKEATDILQVSDSCSIRMVIPLCQMLEKAIFSIDYSNDPCCNAIKERCLTALEEKFSFVLDSSVHIFATVCDPRKKLTFTRSDHKIFKFEKNKCIEICKDYVMSHVSNEDFIELAPQASTSDPRASLFLTLRMQHLNCNRNQGSRMYGRIS